jgi:hypothetical protein
MSNNINNIKKDVIIKNILETLHVETIPTEINYGHYDINGVEIIKPLCFILIYIFRLRELHIPIPNRLLENNLEKIRIYLTKLNNLYTIIF